VAMFFGPPPPSGRAVTVAAPDRNYELLKKSHLLKFLVFVLII